MWQQASTDLDRASSFIPSDIADDQSRTLRVIFGMDELREKLVAQDANIDDRILELLKVFLINEHPFVLQRPRLRLTLTEQFETGLRFVAAYEHDQRRFQLEISHQLIGEITENPKQLKAWVGKSHKKNLFDEPDHWINVWRWSPQPSALKQLKDFAADVRAGKRIKTTGIAFKRMLRRIPRGSHLPSWAKNDLRTLFTYAKDKGFDKLQDTLFEVRFGFELEDDWSQNKNDNDIDTLWQLLRDLPDANVEGNTKIHEILLDEGEGGGWYDPSSYDIAIGSDELSNRQSFEDVVRHEVGHAVHEMKEALVNGWLDQTFGWRTFDSSDDAQIDEWIDEIGGWGRLNNRHKRDVREALRMALGSGSRWSPGPTPVLPATHPWYGRDFAPRLAFEQTGANWFENYPNWYQANNRAFFLNYWYQTFVSVDIATLKLIDGMPSSYAAMSHFEFFAELYAFYFDVDNPKRSIIPKDVADWINKNIGAPAAKRPARRRTASKKGYETVVRPKRRKKMASRARRANS